MLYSTYFQNEHYHWIVCQQLLAINVLYTLNFIVKYVASINVSTWNVNTWNVKFKRKIIP